MSQRATPNQIVATLAALAPDAEPVVNLNVAARDRVALPLSCTRVFERQAWAVANPRAFHFPTEQLEAVATLIKRARLISDNDVMQLGWLWASATGLDKRTFTLPLVSMRVTAKVFHRPGGLVELLRSQAGEGQLKAAREPSVTPLITDPDTRAELEQKILVGGGALRDLNGTASHPRLIERLDNLEKWVQRAVRAAGLPSAHLVDRFGAVDVAAGDLCEVVAQVMLYISVPPTRPVSAAETLRQWTGDQLRHTALAAIYDCAAHHPGERMSSDGVRSSIVVSPAQRAAVARSCLDPVTVLSGPPGSGKTQTVAAIALDAIEDGESVLVAAPSDAAVEALVELMQQIPGPDPIVFGSSERRLAVADRLGQGGGPLLDDDAVESARHAFARAAQEVAALVDGVTELLTAEQLAIDADPALVANARRAAPRWFQPAANLQNAEQLAERAAHVSGLFAGFRRKRRIAALVADAGGTTGDIDQLGEALRTARARQHSLELESTGGLDLSDTWPRLIHAEERRRASHAAWLDATARARERVDGDGRSTMAFVAAALRAGRAVRRQKLAEIDGRRLTRALPLWIGTLRDIDDLLPSTPAMFSIVIVDEASQVDQIASAPALLRGRRAVVVGDPKQLRHVSFISDAAVSAALAANGIGHVADVGRLDVRRLSLFDLAASSATTNLLDEHFRSAPHLIGFPMRRFYDGQVAVATTHPRNHDLDCISVEHVGGRRRDGVNAAEVDRAIAIAGEVLAAARAGGQPARVGIVTPFRDQADAIEQRAVDTFTLDDIDALDLRVGTVHGFQGCERDVVVISTAIDDDSSPAARGFVADPNLFNVMVTRARHQIVVLTSITDPEGLLGEYVRWAEAGPSAPSPARGRRHEVDDLLSELRAAGVPASTGYPAGRHRFDLVVGEGEHALGVTYGVHPEGPAAHIERRLAVARSGWDVYEVFDSRWGNRSAELAVELVNEARRRSSAAIDPASAPSAPP